MARHKGKKFKEHLVREKMKNKKAPVWVYLKTKNRDIRRSRSRNWRFDKLRLKTQHKKKRATLEKHKDRNPKFNKKSK